MDATWTLHGRCMDAAWTAWTLHGLHGRCMDAAWTLHGLHGLYGYTYQALEGIRNITVVLLNQNCTCPLDIISLFLKMKKNYQSMFHKTMCSHALSRLESDASLPSKAQ